MVLCLFLQYFEFSHPICAVYLWLAVRKPCVNLQDIREIKPEELTYDFPVEPIITSSQFELYKGTYNKFTVAIKRYTCPLNTSPRYVVIKQ